MAEAANDLQGKRIAFMVANVGVEEVELTGPWEAVANAGGQPVLVAPTCDQVQAVHGDLEQGDTFDVDEVVADVSSDDFDGLVLPGGVANPDKLRLEERAVDLIRAFTTARTPIAAICHGPWTLVEAGVVRGKTLTSWPSLRTDIELKAFCSAAIEVFAVPRG